VRKSPATRAASKRGSPYETDAISPIVFNFAQHPYHGRTLASALGWVRLRRTTVAQSECGALCGFHRDYTKVFALGLRGGTLTIADSR
jgi:hypothetical protein